MKRVMSFAYHKSALTALAYDARIWLQNLELETVFMPVHLDGATKTWDFKLRFHGVDEIVCCVARSAQINTERGLLAKLDLLQYNNIHGDMCLGLALGYARTNSRRFHHLASVWPCCPCGPGAWRKQTARIEAIDVSAIVGACPYLESAPDVFAPLVHLS